MRAGIATVVLDNSGHDAKERARGTSAKEDLADVVLTLRAAVTFSVDKTGRLELTCRASRFGEMDGAWTLELGGGEYASWRPKDAADARDTFHEACVAALSETSPLGRDKLLAAVRNRQVKFTTVPAVGWLAEFVGDSTSPSVTATRATR